MAIITAPAEVANLRTSGQIAARVLRQVAAHVADGVSTGELNELATKLILAADAKPSFLGYQGYPAALCTSVNDQVVHGIPDRTILIRAGDIIGLDIGVNYHGLFTDHAVSVPVGHTAEANQKLLADTATAMTLGIAAAQVNGHVGDISAAIEKFIRPRGYGIVTQLTGHGLGYSVHDTPAIPNYGPPGRGPILVPGMLLAIEPMVTLGQADVVTQADGWTVVTLDHSCAAHFEHTVWLTDQGPEIITR